MNIFYLYLRNRTISGSSGILNDAIEGTGVGGESVGYPSVCTTV